MEFDADTLKQQVPFYLTSADKARLMQEIEAIAGGQSVPFSLSEYHDFSEGEILQGDSWARFELFNHHDRQCRPVRGLVLSNSCDIAQDNARDLPTRVTFSPLVRLSNFEAVLRDKGVSPEAINAKLASIRQQGTSNIFYLPEGGKIDSEYIIRLDDIHSIPTELFLSSERELLFRLNMTGFYMLTFKLSIHFCRLQEQVDRGFTS